MENTKVNTAAVKLIIKGKVQGVSFRESARKFASGLGVIGYIKNKADGSVEVYAEGSKEKVGELVKYCRKGPLLAKVENVEVQEAQPTGDYEGFWVRY